MTPFIEVTWSVGDVILAAQPCDFIRLRTAHATKESNSLNQSNVRIAIPTANSEANMHSTILPPSIAQSSSKFSRNQALQESAKRQTVANGLGLQGLRGLPAAQLAVAL